MKTNEHRKMALKQTAEQEVLHLLEQVQEVADGDLKDLEMRVLQAAFAIGRGMLEGLLNVGEPAETPPARREGRCGHVQRLVGKRPKELLTLLGKVEFRRAYSHCVHRDEEEEPQPCSHGEAPADEQWGVQQRRTSAGVQAWISYLCARLTMEEAAETFSRLIPLKMSARQALTWMRPVGEALAQQEDEQVSHLWQEAAGAQSLPSRETEPAPEPIERLSIERDGVLARLRRGSVVMEDHEQQRTGDVYRAVKVGAVFQAQPGRERSGAGSGSLGG
jgi:hypothetical protein